MKVFLLRVKGLSFAGEGVPFVMSFPPLVFIAWRGRVLGLASVEAGVLGCFKVMIMLVVVIGLASYRMSVRD